MTVNTSCSITNSSGKTIVVLNAANSSTNVAQNSTKQGYLQDLTLLPAAAGAKTLANGATGSVTLNGTYVDSKGATRPCYIYDLMMSQPDSLFPVMVQSEQLDFKSMGYPAITVSEAAAANMAKALSFCQNIMTSPTSKMAVAFQGAMTAAFKLGTVAESEKAIADFFNQYDTFKGLDFVSYVAVSTWMRGFAYLWGMSDAGKPGQTYYVYSAPQAGKAGATSEGTIVFTSKGGASPADPADRQSGMSISLKTSSATTALTFTEGQLIDSDGGAIALNASFGFKGTFTGKETDTTAWPILTGTMLNKQVIAIPLAPESGWDKFWSELSFQKVINYFLTGMGIWMALDFLKQKLVAKDKKLADDKANENQGQDPDPQQQQDAENAGNDVGDQARAQDQQLADNAAPGDQVQVPQDDAAFNNAVDQARPQAQEAYNQVAQDNVGGGIESAQAQVSDLAEIEVNPAIEEAEGNLIDAQSSLQSGDLSAANSQLGNVNEALPGIVEDMGSQVSAELKEQVAEAVEAQTEASEVAEETSENADEAGSGDEAPFEDGTIPEV